MGKKTVLITDDVEVNRVILREILKDEYNLLEAGDGTETLKIIHQNADHISAVLLDVIMPNMDGFAVLDTLRSEKVLDRIPVLLISADRSVEFERDGYQKGAFDFIHKPFDGMIVKARLKRAVELYENKNHMKEVVGRQTELLEKQIAQLKSQEKQLRITNNNIIDVMSSVVEFRSLESGLHVKRIRRYSLTLAKTVMSHNPEYHLTDEKVEMIASAAALHDVGKIGIPDSVLLKPGKLTPEEFEVMKTHTTKGAAIIDELEWIQDEEMHQISYDICMFHHEKYDGKGYPQGLKGDEIPIAAQIVSVADCFDALTSERCYKPPYSPDEAYSMIEEGQCGTFSAQMLTCLTICLPEFKQIYASRKS
ncbi:MAG: response regulator [Erysipelotrichaceae bacterium]|jgi:putative two-component system response regulator|nr:response regulator [Erysipelotrichaceae bacterium]